jgi:hypothetical protein
VRKLDHARVFAPHSTDASLQGTYSPESLSASDLVDNVNNVERVLTSAYSKASPHLCDRLANLRICPVLAPAYSKASQHYALSNLAAVNQVADGFAGTCL